MHKKKIKKLEARSWLPQQSATIQKKKQLTVDHVLDLTVAVRQELLLLGLEEAFALL